MISASRRYTRSYVSAFPVGATGEDSNATGVDGDQTDNLAAESGAVYVFR